MQELELVEENLLENDLVIDGQYMSEDAMKDELGWSQWLGKNIE